MLGFFAAGEGGLGRAGFCVALLAFAACGGNAEFDGASGGSAGSGGRAALQGGAGPVKGGAPSTGGGTTSGGTAGGDTSDVDPDAAVAGAATTGNGQCTGHSLGEVVMNIQAKHPELGDINTFYEPQGSVGGQGNYIYAFPNDDGFRLVFTRGSGDCESGCIDMAYWYFETRSDCFPYRVGFYSRKYDSASNCFVYDGTPMWGMPGTPPPNGGDCVAPPDDISGEHALVGYGTQFRCSVSGDSVRFSSPLLLEVRQTPSDPARAGVYLSGTGNDLIEGSALAGGVTGSKLRVDDMVSRGDDGAPDCGASVLISIHYDFASMSGTLRTEEVRYLDCASMEYCKGGLDLALIKE